MSDLQRVGLIGVGLMGHGIGKNILKHGYTLGILAHRNRIPTESLLARGAIESATSTAIAESVHQTYVMADSPGVGDKFVRYLVDTPAQVNNTRIKR